MPEMPPDPDLRPEDTDLVAGIEAALAQRRQDDTPDVVDDAAVVGDDTVGTDVDDSGDLVPSSEDVTQDGPDEGATDATEPEEERFEFGGMSFTEQSARDAAGLLQWFSTLDEDQARRVFAAASGELTGIRPETPAPAPEAPQIGVGQQVNTDPFAEIREYTDPATMAALDGLAAKITQQEAMIVAQQAQERTRTEQDAQVAWQQVANEFPEKYGLTEFEFAALSNRVQSSEILSYYAPKTTNPYDAFTKSFEHVLFTDEEFREKLFQSKLDTELAERAAVASQNEAKKRNAASVTSTSGSVSRANIPVDRRAMTPQEKQAALAADIAAIQAGGQG